MAEDQASPQGAQQTDKRQHRRAKLITEVRCEAMKREEIMLTRDISVGGLFVSAKDPFPMDSEVSITLRLQSKDPLISCSGKVVYSMKNLGMGVQFSGLRDETRASIQKFVDGTL